MGPHRSQNLGKLEILDHVCRAPPMWKSDWGCSGTSSEAGFPLPKERRRLIEGIKEGDNSRDVEVGAGGSHRRPGSAMVARIPEVKKEVQVIDDSNPDRSRNRKKSRDIGSTLARAAQIRSAADEAKENKKRKKSRSRLRGRRRRKKRRSSSSSSSRGSSPRSSSSEGSLLAPLKKKSMKAPGSVFRMLKAAAVERLSADGNVEEGCEALGLRHQQPKLLTYY